MPTPGSATQASAITRPSRLLSNRVRESAWAYLFLAPFFLGLLFFIVGPVFAAFAISFTSWDLLSPPRWVGLDNYRELANDRLFWIALKNTLYFTGVSVPVTLVLALGLAALMNRKLRGIEALRAIYFFPVTASIVAVSLLWAWMYTPDFGIINYLLSYLGIP
jgi:multiple sugar transport system permease protein